MEYSKCMDFHAECVIVDRYVTCSKIQRKKKLANWFILWHACQENHITGTCASTRIMPCLFPPSYFLSGYHILADDLKQFYEIGTKLVRPDEGNGVCTTLKDQGTMAQDM